MLAAASGSLPTWLTIIVAVVSIGGGATGLLVAINKIQDRRMATVLKPLEQRVETVEDFKRTHEETCPKGELRVQIVELLVVSRGIKKRLDEDREERREAQKEHADNRDKDRGDTRKSIARVHEKVDELGREVAGLSGRIGARSGGKNAGSGDSG